MSEDSLIGVAKGGSGVPLAARRAAQFSGLPWASSYNG